MEWYKEVFDKHVTRRRAFHPPSKQAKLKLGALQSRDAKISEKHSALLKLFRIWGSESLEEAILMSSHMDFVSF